MRAMWHLLRIFYMQHMRKGDWGKPTKMDKCWPDLKGVYSARDRCLSRKPEWLKVVMEQVEGTGGWARGKGRESTEQSLQVPMQIELADLPPSVCSFPRSALYYTCRAYCYILREVWLFFIYQAVTWEYHFDLLKIVKSRPTKKGHTNEQLTLKGPVSLSCLGRGSRVFIE